MAAVMDMPRPVPAQTKPSLTPIISQTHVTKENRVPFQPARHLAFEKMPNLYTMKDLGFSGNIGVSPIAVSEPFRLFTEEAVMQMRQEVLSPEVFENCQYSSNLAHCYLRGFANKYAPFVYDVWKHPETLAIVSRIAGIDLVPEMDLEIAHINISVNSEEDDKPVVGWHTDSYPFVAVTMLSDCVGMIGGETALRTGNGDIMKVRGPQMGCTVVMQGRYIEHQALRTLGTTERITMVTSFRPKNPLLRDDTVLTTVRPISNINDLYNQFAEYRLQMLEERIRLQLKEIHDLCAAGRRVTTKKLKAFLEEQEKFLAHMSREMVDDGDIIIGNIQQDHITSTASSNVGKRRRLT